ncbi:MAG TPA: glycosyltransferase, partial [Candidatus Paceibacterota bacterium]|nr:glycosyltransferase [Candidatus Paceibacterota bacterium]
MAFRVLLVGGGSGGHVFPLVSVAHALKHHRPDVQVKLMGDGSFVPRAAKEYGLPYSTIIAPKLRKYEGAPDPLALLKLPFALAEALWKLFWYMPDAVFAKGGYTSIMPVLVARLYAIPVYLHESDSVPGLANRSLAKHAKVVFTAYEKAAGAFAPYPTVLVGNPVRPGLGGMDAGASRTAFGLSPDKRTVLIIGGSQGADQLNKVILEGLVQMVQDGYQLIHLCGEKNYAAVNEQAQKILAEGAGEYAEAVKAQYRVYPFLDEKQLAAAYAACDVAVTRAGANLLAELAWVGKPMIIVPLPGSAQNHQLFNAAEAAKYGNIIIEGVNLTPNILIS